mmetsp:Transcript_29897/g.95229  ORF Transcript_29897/g.95229 Transcript_29897/m.95229 type:complete len:240 (+) Transcript_29897:155-874(+)
MSPACHGVRSHVASHLVPTVTPLAPLSLSPSMGALSSRQPWRCVPPSRACRGPALHVSTAREPHPPPAAPSPPWVYRGVLVCYHHRGPATALCVPPGARRLPTVVALRLVAPFLSSSSPFAPSSSSCCRPLLPRWLVCRPAGRVCSHALGFHSRPFHRSVPGGAVAVLAAFVFSPHSGGAAASVPSTHRPPPSPAPFFPPHRLSVHPFRLGRCGFVPHQEGGADHRRRACDARSPYATG